VATAGHCVDPASAKDLILKNASSHYLDQFPDLPEAQDPAKTLQWLQANARVEGITADQDPQISIVVPMSWTSGPSTKATSLFSK
jgi:serine protease Do